ncbi:MAG: hypothetical protein ACRDRJ_16930 [Streptosporangiaceae bacterium]
MLASVSRPVLRAQQLSRLWWLPARGRGNGLDDGAWTQIAEVSADDVGPLLTAFRARSVPAYAAPPSGAWVRRGRRASAEPTWRVWVGASAYGRAEQALLVMLPTLRRGGRDAGR